MQSNHERGMSSYDVKYYENNQLFMYLMLVQVTARTVPLGSHVLICSKYK